MEIVPTHYKNAKPVHLALSSVATVASNSLAAPGTGLAYIPIYAWYCASAVGSMRFTNGTGGSTIFEIQAQAGGVWSFEFWEEPNKLLTNKAPVLESETNGIGVHSFHVWMIPVRAGAGQDALGQ